MSQIDLNTLASFHIFKGLNQDELKLLAGIMKVVSFKQGTKFIEQSSKSDDVYFVLSGRVEVSINLINSSESEAIAKLGPNDTVGEFILVRQGRRSASAKAMDDVNAYSATTTELLKLFDAHPHLGYVIFHNLCKVIVDRIEDTNMLARRLVIR